MANLIEDPGFEEVPSAWVLGTTCSVGTAVIQGSVVRSGALALAITRVTIGGVQRCGYAERLVTGIVPGRRYKIKVWHRTAALTSIGIVQILVGGVQKGSFATNSLSWISFTTLDFTVPTTSAMLRLQVPGNSVTTTHTRYIDDLEWESGDVPDSAAPSADSRILAAASADVISGAPSAEDVVASVAPNGIVASVSAGSIIARVSKG